MSRPRRVLLPLVVVAVVVLQVILGVVLFTAEPPEQRTTMVGLLPPRTKGFPAQLAKIRNVASDQGADLIVLVADPCTAGLWTCQEERGRGPHQQRPDPPQPSPPDLGPAGGTPPIQLVVDHGRAPSVVDSQPASTRVINAAGTELRPGSDGGGSNVLLFAWAVGLVALLGAAGWRAATAAAGGPAPPKGPRRPSANTPPAPVRPRPADRSADLVEVFLQNVPTERARRREPQCPDCGSFDTDSAPAAGAEEAAHHCRYCGFDWTITRGAPWPTVIVNPRAGR